MAHLQGMNAAEKRGRVLRLAQQEGQPCSCFIPVALLDNQRAPPLRLLAVVLCAETRYDTNHYTFTHNNCGGQPGTAVVLPLSDCCM